MNWGFPPLLVSFLNMVDITKIDHSEAVRINVFVAL